MNVSNDNDLEYSVETAESTYPWYAIQIRARQERIIASALHVKGYDVFMPMRISKRRWSDRVKELELPLFPGYLFCRFDVQKRLPILKTPGVLNILGINKTPFPVDETEIAAIQSIVASRLNAQPWPYLQVGQVVRVERGPLVGLEGILVSVKKPYRLVVSVSLLNRSVAVEIDHDWVTPVDRLPMATPEALAIPSCPQPVAV